MPSVMSITSIQMKGLCSTDAMLLHKPTLGRSRTATLSVRCGVSSEQQPKSVGTARWLNNGLKASLVSIAVATSFQAVCLSPAVVYPAHADEESESTQYLSPYEKRQADLKKRRELMQKLRDDALNKASSVVESAPTTQPETEAPAPEEQKSFTFSSPLSYPSVKKSEPEAPAAAPAAPFKGFFNRTEEAVEEKKPAADAQSESKPWWEKIAEPSASQETAPLVPATPPPPPPPLFTPPPPKPAPAPAPLPKVEAKKEEPVKKPEPVKVEAKAPEPTKPGKRKGPLPLWFAELLVLGVYTAIGLAATKYNQQSSQVLSLVGDAVGKATAKLEEATAKK